MFLPPARGSDTRLLRSLAALGAALPLLAIQAGAQDREPIPAPELDAGAAPTREVVAGGPVTFVPITDLADTVPLPVPPVYAAGPSGEVEAQPASGDPFFLGFAAGSYYPPAGESVDPELAERLALLPAERERETYGFVMFSKRITEERLAVLDSYGARMLGRHPHYAVKVALPADSIDAIGALDFVRWVGFPETWQKLHPHLTRRLASARADDVLDVCISLYESDWNDASTEVAHGTGEATSPGDAPVMLAPELLGKLNTSNGWRQRSLEGIGVQIRAYERTISTFRARVRAGDVARVRDLDFVQFVELEQPLELMHDESMAMISADLTRVTDDGGAFGQAVPAIVDSGIEYSHEAFGFYGLGWDLASTASAWDDGNGHGSHVAGSYFADPPAARAQFTGVAPGVGCCPDRRVYNLKVMDDTGAWGWATLDTIFGILHEDYTLGSDTTPRPHVINNSWGSAPGPTPYVGSEANPRAIDTESYIYQQLYVFAGGNYGPNAGTIIAESTGKNVLAVGNVIPYTFMGGDPGDVYVGSSRGPCGDGRWKPNVCAPGTSIRSVDAADLDGYKKLTGTSMAAPHAAGVATALVDQWSFLRYNPSTLSAVMMATAITKNDELLTTPGELHLDTYGTGRVSAWKALNPDSQQATYFWGYVASDTAHAELDFSIGSGATRLTTVMTYHEIGADAGAGKALHDNLDMRLDREPFSGSGNIGDYTLQISNVDNTEVRSINNPGTGMWKVKVWPQDVGAGWFKPYVGVCVIVTYGDTTPDANFNLAADRAYAQPNELIEFDTSVYNPTYVASAVFLDSEKSSGFVLTASDVVLADGTPTSLMENNSSGHDVLLGDIVHGQTRAARWTGRWASEGVKTFTVSAESDNMINETKAVDVTVDGTAPSTPGNVQSTTHDVGEHSCDVSVTVTWNPATDALAGLDGYSVAWSNNANGDPGTTIDLGAGVTTHTQVLYGTPLPWYFHIRALDKAGNAGSVVHLGPFHIGQAQVTSYCNSNKNSTGKMALLTTSGPVCLADDALTLRTVDLPQNKFGHYLFSDTQAHVPFFGGSEGVLCLGGSIVRFSKNVLSSGATGEMVFSPDLTDLPQNTVIQHGETWNWQLWYRDNNPTATSNTSNAIEIVFD